MLTYRVNEINAANIIAGERDKLNARLKICENAQKITTDLNEIAVMLDGTDDDKGARQLIKTSADILLRDAEILKSAPESAESLLNSLYSIEGVIDAVNGILSETDYSLDEINAINERLDELDRLSKKYGKTEDDILSYRDEAETELERLKNTDTILDELNEQFSAALTDVKQRAKELSETRKKAANEFSERIMQELKFLNMPSVTFIVKRTATPLTETGIDNMEFLISANAGEPAKPLAKIASGGELSRIMLAIKTVLADKDKIDTLIFDEIDTGVSGSAAEKIAQKIKAISFARQVLCVTHLPQIAAYADEHFLISKAVRDDRTVTTVTALDKKGRIGEIARMSGGMNITETGLKSAEELIEAAANGGLF